MESLCATAVWHKCDGKFYLNRIACTRKLERNFHEMVRLQSQPFSNYDEILKVLWSLLPVKSNRRCNENFLKHIKWGIMLTVWHNAWQLKFIIINTIQCDINPYTHTDKISFPIHEINHIYVWWWWQKVFVEYFEKFSEDILKYFEDIDSVSEVISMISND